MNRAHDHVVARQFGTRFSLACFAYVFALCLHSYASKHQTFGPRMIDLLSVVPAGAMIGMIGLFGIFLNNLEDEFQRNVLQKSLVGAIGCVLALTSVFGSIGIVNFTPRLAMFFVFPTFWFFFGICAFVVRLYYGSPRSHE